MQLRPHHILCIAHYEGKGYSEAFNIKMQELINALESGGQFELIFGPDDLCASCPNLTGGNCTAEEKVRKYDRLTAEMLGIAESQRLNRDIFKSANQKIYEPDKFDQICSDCEWSYICRKAQTADRLFNAAG